MTVAVVTGASRGIGASIVKQLAADVNSRGPRETTVVDAGWVSSGHV